MFLLILGGVWERDELPVTAGHERAQVPASTGRRASQYLSGEVPSGKNR